MKMMTIRVFAFVYFISVFIFNRNLAFGKKAKSDSNDNQGNTPFFLQDPYDQMCLGPNGFTLCDENALWMLTKRNGKKTYSLVSLLVDSKNGLCLSKKREFFGLFNSDSVSLSTCKSSGAKSWSFEFIDQSHIKLSMNGQCLVRGKKKYKNSASLQSCSKGEFIPLQYHPTAVHENGFYIKTADGKCFDGFKFENCEKSLTKVLWGVGIKYSWGEARRYFFRFAQQERQKCISVHRSKIEEGECSEPAVYGWALSNGQLSTRNGKYCASRKPDDTVELSKCLNSHEFIYMDVPTIYLEDQVAEMLNNPNLTKEEKNALIEAMRKKNSLIH